MQLTQLPWTDPLALSTHCSSDALAVLYSGADAGFTGDYSYICIGAQQKIAGCDLNAVRHALGNTSEWHENFWIGWLGYGLKNQLETLPKDAPGIIHTADICLIKPDTIYRFNHRTKLVECYGEHQLHAVWQRTAMQCNVEPIASLQSNMSNAAYLQKVEKLIKEITVGNLYQANLTRKFFGTFERNPHGAVLFQTLCQQNPAPYSAYLRMDGLEVISSSPEQFLRIDADGTMRSRPIKGSIARGLNAEEDELQKSKLLTSVKDKAENLMIVDLMRHDFSRVCRPGSVNVDAMFELTTHPHIHHLSSTISGKSKHDVAPLDAILACFPPGSMTGAPKIRAMQICSELEQQARGIYSGVLGWFAGDDSAELSVVIRTLLIQEKNFEFQVGGGIVADSKPELELHETLAKAKGIAQLLSISQEQLAAL